MYTRASVYFYFDSASAFNSSLSCRHAASLFQDIIRYQILSFYSYLIIRIASTSLFFSPLPKGGAGLGNIAGQGCLRGAPQSEA